MSNGWESYIELENLPTQLEFPDQFKNKISYDTQRKRLVFKGLMCEEEKGKLLSLSQDGEYQNAIKKLFTISRKVKLSCVNRDDVYDLKNPAYVVKDVVGGGCVVAWNGEFERLTNFTPSDIDYKFCHQLFRGLFQHKQTKKWLEVCYEGCDLRREGKPGVVRNLWINSKDQRGGDIKRLVDVYIFPFETEDEGKINKYTLHILIDKEASRSLSYFDSDIQEKGGIIVQECGKN